MVDNINPASQFHPYQPQDAIPHSELPESGLKQLLKKVGIDSSKFDAMGRSVENLDVRGRVNQARGLARQNPGLVLGGLAALVIGAGLMRRRSGRK